MKAFKVITVLVLMLLLQTGGIGTTYAAVNWQNLTITNRTGYTIKALYIAPASKDEKTIDWGKEQLTYLGKAKLDDGKYIALTYNPDRTNWWMKIIFKNGVTRAMRIGDLAGKHQLTIVSMGKDKYDNEQFKCQLK